MRRLIRNLWNYLAPKSSPGPNRQQGPHPWRARPRLEILEDRLTPSTLPGVVSGAVQLGSGAAFSGVSVTLSGVTNSGISVNASVLTKSDGSYAFTQVQAGRYNLSTNAGAAFLNGQTSFDFNVDAAGQFSTGNFSVVIPGLAPQFVSMASFLSSSTPFQMSQPGLGLAAAFSLDGLAPLLTQSLSLSHGATTVDLSANFVDPKTTDTIVQFQTPQGNIDVELFDSDAPQTVTNFLDYIESDDFQDTLFTRESNLSQISELNPIPTPFQVLQGGALNITSGPATTPPTFASMHAFQSINLETTGHANTVGTLAMAEKTVPGQTSITNGFFFNLTNNSSTLGTQFPAFGQVVSGPSSNPTTVQLSTYANLFTPHDEVAADSSFFALPLNNGTDGAGMGYSPPAGDQALTGATTANLAQITKIQVIQPSAGHLTYSNATSSNPGVVTVQLGQNTAASAFSANQLQLTPVAAGTATITLQITDAAGDIVIKTFTVTVS
jgi:cyclophilin family peptidyl-prolyl cis-trans isomerase